MGTVFHQQSGFLTEIVGQSIAANILKLHFLVSLCVEPFVFSVTTGYFEQENPSTLCAQYGLLSKYVVLCWSRYIPVVFDPTVITNE